MEKCDDEGISSREGKLKSNLKEHFIIQLIHNI